MHPPPNPPKNSKKKTKEKYNILALTDIICCSIQGQMKTFCPFLSSFHFKFKWTKHGCTWSQVKLFILQHIQWTKAISTFLKYHIFTNRFSSSVFTLCIKFVDSVIPLLCHDLLFSDPLVVLSLKFYCMFTALQKNDSQHYCCSVSNNKLIIIMKIMKPTWLLIGGKKQQHFYHLNVCHCILPV